MILLDTNLVIYSLESAHLRRTLSTLQIASNWIIKAETLGWKYLDDPQERIFRDFFENSIFLPLDDAIFETAIQIRKSRGIKLPDAIIAATALRHNCELWTHNIGDFTDIPKLQVSDPLVSVPIE